MTGTASFQAQEVCLYSVAVSVSAVFGDGPVSGGRAVLRRQEISTMARGDASGSRSRSDGSIPEPVVAAEHNRRWDASWQATGKKAPVFPGFPRDPPQFLFVSGEPRGGARLHGSRGRSLQLSKKP